MKDFDVFELISDMKPIGSAKYNVNNGEIRVEFEDRILILKERQTNNESLVPKALQEKRRQPLKKGFCYFYCSNCYKTTLHEKINEKWICPKCNNSFKAKKRYILKEKNPNLLENKITKKIKTTYSVNFDKRAIKEISLLLNDNYNSILSAKKLKELFFPIFEKYHKTTCKHRFQAYILYFIETGQLKKQKGGKNAIYGIIQTNLIPKKEKKELGFLDELEMS